MSKKIIALVLAVLVAAVGFVLVACNGGEDTTTAAPSGSESTSSADAASDLAYVKGKGTLVIGITDYAPMNYKEEGSDKWTGFDTEYAEAVCKKLGVEPKFVVLADWGAKVNELNSKAIDAVWNGMTITDELKTSMDITDAYVVNQQVVVCKKADSEKFKTADSIKDAKIAVEGGGVAEGLVADYKNVTSCKDQAAALLEVKTGAADVAVIDMTMAKTLTADGASYSDLAYTAELSNEEYGIGFRKGSDLCAEVNLITAGLKAEGTLKTLAEKYKLTLAA